MINRRSALRAIGMALIGTLTLVLITCPRRMLACVSGVISYLNGFRQLDVDGKAPEFVKGNRVKILFRGDRILPAMLSAIHAARRNLRWQVMLFNSDEAGRQLAAALAAAARRGVSVQLSFDRTQTTDGPPFALHPPGKRRELRQNMKRMLEELKSAGAVVLDNPAGIGRRATTRSQAARRLWDDLRDRICISANHADHRKIFIVDDEIAIVGGTNVGDQYLYHEPPDLELGMDQAAESRRAAGRPEAWRKWLDVAVQVRGPVVRDLAKEFSLRWSLLGGLSDPVPPTAKPCGNTPIQVLPQRPGDGHIAAKHLTLIGEAENEILVSSPYVSYDPILSALSRSAQRGVQVRLVTPGAYNDVELSRRIFRSLSSSLLKAGIEIFENNRRMIHSKIMVVDRRWVSIGSFNLNYRSSAHDFELNLLIDDKTVAQEMATEVFGTYFLDSQRLERPYRLRLNPVEQILVPFS